MKFRNLKTSVVYDHYWIFATKRQDLFFNRYNNLYMNCSGDEVLNTYKFTNTYRASDRVSQYLIRNVIYNGDQNIREVFFRVLLFKLFNRIETWEYLLSTFGKVTLKSFDIEKYDQALTRYKSQGNRVYSAAYIMPSRAGKEHYDYKHTMHLCLIKEMLNDDLPDKIVDSKSLESIYQLLLSYKGIGKFLAFQYAIDLNYSNIVDFDENDFVVAGPGALNGIKKCFIDVGKYTPEDIINFMVDNQEREFERLGLDFKTLWGRELKPIDCQNIFCEVDKYARVVFPEYSGVTGRSRIKQKYKVNDKPIDYFYPPKWGINEIIDTQRSK